MLNDTSRLQLSLGPGRVAYEVDFTVKLSDPSYDPCLQQYRLPWNCTLQYLLNLKVSKVLNIAYKFYDT